MCTIVNRLAWLSLLLWAACASNPEAPETSSRVEAIVYGADDRLDVFEHPDPTLRALARRSIVALVRTSAIIQGDDGPSLLTESAEKYGLCTAERFADQPIVSTCSGVLIANDLVLTAAHCVAEDRPEGVSCDELSLVFDYYYTARGKLAPVRKESLYTCRAVVTQSYETNGTPLLDYAVIRLDRPVAEQRSPVAISPRVLSASERVATISCPIGMPIKIDSNAEVVDPRLERGDYFRLKSDVFEGSSGGAVLDADAKLVGILSKGSIDFAATDAGCATAAVVPEDEHALILERATYVGPVIEALCSTGGDDRTLCAAAPVRSQDCSVMHLGRASRLPRLLIVSIVAAMWLRRGRKVRALLARG